MSIYDDWLELIQWIHLLQKPRKFFRKMSQLPYKDVFGNSTHHTYDKRLRKRVYKDGTEYAGGEYSEEMIPGNIHWEEK